MTALSWLGSILLAVFAASLAIGVTRQLMHSWNSGQARGAERLKAEPSKDSQSNSAAHLEGPQAASPQSATADEFNENLDAALQKFFG